MQLGTQGLQDIYLKRQCQRFWASKSHAFLDLFRLSVLIQKHQGQKYYVTMFMSPFVSISWLKGSADQLILFDCHLVCEHIRHLTTRLVPLVWSLRLRYYLNENGKRVSCQWNFGAKDIWQSQQKCDSWTHGRKKLGQTNIPIYTWLRTKGCRIRGPWKGWDIGSLYTIWKL